MSLSVLTREVTLTCYMYILAGFNPTKIWAREVKLSLLREYIAPSTT